MDIIAVNHSRLKASLDEAVFDINAALEQPLENLKSLKYCRASCRY